MNEPVAQALAASWHKQAATTSLERWQAICAAEKWTLSATELASMVKVFGASWYFTRFIYFCGIEVLACFRPDDFATRFDQWLSQIVACDGDMDDETSLQRLRTGKNKAMLYVLVNYLEGRINQQTMERALTRIADTVIIRLIESVGLAANGDDALLVLGMGSLAGYEMNYGSDLDMIFLAPGAANRLEHLVRKTRKLLRIMPLHAPAGALYDIDMRLRPHGNSGTLITSFDRFIEFHQADRAIWERQMLTRHRCIYGDRRLAAELDAALTPAIYQSYSAASLAAPITAMRLRVERELGRPRGKYEIKRGAGGIMDIDFLTHYLQLLHGHRQPCLQTASTRTALQQIGEMELLATDTVATLRHGYDYLKQVECALRVFDMKPISQFLSAPEAVLPLARALGHRQASEPAATAAFLDEYQQLANRIRGVFHQVFSPA